MENNYTEIHNELNIEYMWEELGGDFDNFQQILFEFVDNSISNITKYSKQGLQNKDIIISLEVKNDNEIIVRVEDSGTGILNIDSALQLGSKSAQETTLNEHGFGLKHALAAADKDNKNWKIYTRTESSKNNHNYFLISAPYKTNNWGFQTISDLQETWPGKLNCTGTIVEVIINKTLLSTLTVGIPGANIRCSYKTLIDYLREDLSFTYSKILEDELVNISLKLINNGNIDYDVSISPLKPSWESTPIQGSEHYNLGNGMVEIEYQFGSIIDSANHRYYKRCIPSQGAEIRLNGRTLVRNLVKEIWGKEKHNSLNHFLAIINVKSDDSQKLPKTKTAKYDFKTDDIKYESLLQWIHQKYPNIKEQEESNDSFNERQLFKQLQQQKATHNPGATVSTEEHVFPNEMDLRIDLYQFSNGNVTIYEGKKIKTTPKDVYQLRMYWDGLVFKKIQPNHGIILAKEHPDSVKRMVDYVNSMKDSNGNNYNIQLKTWNDERNNNLKGRGRLIFLFFKYII